jgi:hypothetical protein
MIRRFLRTTSDIFYPIEDKSIYYDSIVFITDTKEIWSGGVYFTSNNENGSNNFSVNAKDVSYISEFIDHDNVQDMLDYLLSLHKCDFDESFNNDFGFSLMPETSFDLTFDITFK